MPSHHSYCPPVRCGADKAVEAEDFPPPGEISFVKEEGRSHQLRIPGKTAGQGDGESGEDRMHGQRMSRGSVGDPDEIGH